MLILTGIVGLPILITLHFWYQHWHTERIRRHQEYLDSLRPYFLVEFENMITKVIHINDIPR